MTITFVTSYLNSYTGSNCMNRTHKWRFDHFEKIAVTGIQLCVFVDADVYDEFMEIAKRYNNIIVMPPVIYSQLPIVQECAKYENLLLPKTRNPEKDTDRYLQTINSKVHFVHEAIRENPWNSTHFAWVDFSISHVFHNLKKSQDYLRYLAKQSWTKSFFVIPGCWPKYNMREHPHFLNHIHWRFCGGFFIGDKSSVEDFVQEYQKQSCNYLEKYNTLTWEVNIWAWMEANNHWKPTWYYGDHNDSIIILPASIVAQPFRIEQVFSINLPSIDNYLPSSSGYVQDNEGNHWLNTRFVNYFLNPNGCYTFLDNTNIIKTQNIISSLNNEESMTVLESNVMNEETVAMTASSSGHMAEGLEDIRLYKVQDNIRFIASTNNYSPTSRIQMVVGNYYPETREYSDCSIIEAPDMKSHMEKNWTPFVRNVQDCVLFDGKDYMEEEWFIYKWCPMELGQIVINDDGVRQLNIKDRIKTSHIPWFSKFRGSTPLVECEKGWVCVVHFSEEDHPRKYYHNFVWFDRDTINPIQYSDPFYFKKEGVEFCTGMKLHDEETNTFVLWISQFDRDPLMVIGHPPLIHLIE